MRYTVQSQLNVEITRNFQIANKINCNVLLITGIEPMSLEGKSSVLPLDNTSLTNPPIRTGITIKKIIIKAWAVTIELYN